MDRQSPIASGWYKANRLAVLVAIKGKKVLKEQTVYKCEVFLVPPPARGVHHYIRYTSDGTETPAVEVTTKPSWM